MSDTLYLSSSASFKLYGSSIYLYQKDTDSLFALDEEAFALLKKARSGIEPDFFSPDILSFLLAEKILVRKRQEPAEVKTGIFPSDSQPPLKYLHLLITNSCNFRCRHCYVEFEEKHADPELIIKAASEFESSGGLRLIISGGEPLMHPEFTSINEALKAFTGVRKILNTNGWHLAEMEMEEIAGLAFEEIQLSLDGPEEVHDRIRRRGSFKRVLQSAHKLKQAGKHLAIATVVNAWNYREFDILGQIVKDIKPFRWSVDFICPNEQAEKLGLVPPLKAALLMQFSFNSGKHENQKGFACGATLCSLLPDGKLVKCDYFPDISGGNVREKGLLKAWLDLPRIRLKQLECADCGLAESCGGGCRYRAMFYNKKITGKDPVLCMLLGCHEGS